MGDQMSKFGQLVIIGGAEKREGDKVILGRLCELAGGKKGRIVVFTTASRLAAEGHEKDYRDIYEPAFTECGIGEVVTLPVFTREAANAPANVAAIENATCLFMTGGSQDRLTSILAGTEVCRAMHHGFRERGLVIAGTSAGASVLSEHMLLGGPSDVQPRKGAIPVAAGLGFLYQAIIDQHFSERQRLSRLLSVLAQNPFLIGLGIDEDTALIVHPHHALEVIGAGTVTVVDGRTMIYTNINEVDEGETLGLSNIQLHVLQSGFRHVVVHGRERNAFEEVLETVMTTVRNTRRDPVPAARGRNGASTRKEAS
jgi:cyanophycinase